MSNYSYKSFPAFFLAALLTGSLGCTKVHINDTILPTGQLNTTNSSIRLFNLFGFPLDVTVNNIPLTSYSATNSTGIGQGVSIFPSGVWSDGTSFTVPNTLLDKNSHAAISISPRITFSGNAPIPLPADTVITNNPLQPVDYYILSDGHYHALPRSAAVPAQPMDFKIRVINQGTATDADGLTGPVSVTYADGSAVDPALTNIAPGQISDYVELPYGSIEFKVFANQRITQQLTELPIKPNYIGSPLTPVYDQEARFSPTRTFKPGGVYSIYISSNVINYTDEYCFQQYYIPINSYRVITENSPAVNFTYARLQAVNVYPAVGSVTMQIDGQPLGKAIAYAQHTDYNIQVQGPHTVEAVNASGNVLASKNITLYPYDNISAWLYQQDSVADICFSAMDMNQVQTGSLINCLNLCSGLPYLTLTRDDQPFYSPNATTSDMFDTATTNLALGQPVIADPFLFYDLKPGLTGGCGAPVVAQWAGFPAMRAFQSGLGPPLKVPGSYLDNITPVVPADLIANPALYSASGLPAAEPGAYTIAVIGRVNDSGPGSFPPQFFILKHSK